MQHLLYLTSAHRKLNITFWLQILLCNDGLWLYCVMEYTSSWPLLCLVVCTDIFINPLFFATGDSM